MPAKKSGFTLLEIIISFAIFGILLGIMVFGFRDSRKIQVLKLAASELVENIRSAQNKTMSGSTYQGSFPIGGYGLHLDITNEKDQYLIFADKAAPIAGICQMVPNERYDNELHYDGLKCSGDLEVKKITLSERVEIVKIEVSPDGTTWTSPPFLDLAFKPPRPTIYAGWTPVEAERDPGQTLCAYANYSVNIFLKQLEKNVCRKILVIGVSGQMREEGAPCP